MQAPEFWNAFILRGRHAWALQIRHNICDAQASTCAHF